MKDDEHATTWIEFLRAMQGGCAGVLVSWENVADETKVREIYTRLCVPMGNSFRWGT
jgi:hypothetical protein